MPRNDGPYDYFVVLAGMRTGSNYLEASLNALDGVTCHGEAFNSAFMGHQGRRELLGVSMAGREADPFTLLDAIRRSDALAGFRLFHDHDPRIRAHVLDDPRCAKIVLTRNPLDSYVSLLIAAQTGQWKLTDPRRRKTARPRFSAAGFEAHLAADAAFRHAIRHALQRTGQAAFPIGYDDLGDVAVLNGLARFLGVDARLAAPSGALTRQNPEPVAEKVANPEEMTDALARIDRYGALDDAPVEAPRGPAVPAHVVAPAAGLIFMPVPGGPDAALRAWLEAASGGAPLQTGHTQKTLRAFKRDHPGHRGFTVLRHPVARAYAALAEHAMAPERGQLRAALRDAVGLAMPEPEGFDALDPAARRGLFLAFVDFLGRNLAGRTGLNTRPAWATQCAAVEGFARFAAPDQVMRESQLAPELAHLARLRGIAAPAAPAQLPMPGLDAIHDAEIEAAVRKVYQRDYVAFGFGPWRG